jgi:hypothetical protein
MADICPTCYSADVQQGLDEAHCLTCGAALNLDGKGGLETTDREALNLPSPSDSSLATPTATPVYAEDALTRQPVIDNNQEPVPTKVEPGEQTAPAPDLEAQNVAGELSDETPQEKTSGGPDDQPRTADLGASGEPAQDTFVDHSTQEQPTPAFVAPTEADQTNLEEPQT